MIAKRTDNVNTHHAKTGHAFFFGRRGTEWFFFLLLFVAFLSPTPSFALEPIVLQEGWERFTPDQGMEILEDESNELTIDDILAGAREQGFVQSTDTYPAFGVSRSTFWGRFTITNPQEVTQEWFLESWHLAKYIDLFIVEDNKVVYARSEGRAFPYAHREVDFHNITFTGEIAPQSEYTVYIKLQATVPIFAFSLWSPDAFQEIMTKDLVLNGFLYGIMIITLLYNLFVYFSLKDRRYLYYVYFILSGIFLVLSLNQIGFQLFWPDSPQWELLATVLALPFHGVFSVLLCQEFLQTRENTPTGHRILDVFTAAFALSALLGLFDFAWSLKLLLLLPAPFMVVLVATTIRRYRSGFTPARYFLLAWFSFFVVVSIRALGVEGILPINQFLFVFGRQIAFAIDAVILSMALTDFINLLKAEKEKADFEKMEAQRIHTEELEQRVEERTAELKLRQEQLIIVEKQASVGHLVVGVAHEINTPIGICLTAASHFQELNNDIKTHIENNTLKKSLLDKFLQDSEKVSGLILNNLNRTGDLVRNFKMVHADQRSREKREFDLKEYLEGILKGFSGDFGEQGIAARISCPVAIAMKSFPGSIALVLTNLITNSLTHAFTKDGRKEINIEIALQEHDKVVVTYSDNGKGISSENLDKLFEPFFTTNRIGGGTGLGLHIVSTVVTQDLQGFISCDSTEGQGTTFTLTMPKEI